MTRSKRLSRLTSRLASLRGRRRAVRLGAAICGFLTATLWILALVFVIDWSLTTNRPQRLVLLGLCSASLVWVFRKVSKPFLGVREDLVDMALLVERRAGISSELVAAIEFDQPGGDRWGSAELRSAVIDQAARLEPSLDILQGFTRKPLLWRAALLGVTCAALSAWVFRFPEHTIAFLSRLALGLDRYPTRTVIEGVFVNGIQIFPASSSQALRVPLGTPLRLSLVAAGELPFKAEGRLEGSTGATLGLELLPSPATGAFEGMLPRLSENVAMSVVAGDAWIESLAIKVVPRPAVTIELKVTPPEYTRSAGDLSELTLDAQSTSVPEGASVTIRVVCANKRLVKASASLADMEVPLHLELDGRAAVLLPAGTSLQEIYEPGRYSVQVEDEDGLGLESPLGGVVRVEEDQRPRIVASLLMRVALPIAKPWIAYGAEDDHGVARLEAVIQIARISGETEESRRTVFESGPQAPLEPVVRGRYALDLAQFALVKGDQVSVTLVATDFRGAREPFKASSSTLILSITDERGMLEAMSEFDERTVKQLDLIIERLLGMGGQP